jgi:hypothetical protein
LNYCRPSARLAINKRKIMSRSNISFNDTTTELLSEYLYLPCNSLKQLERDICNIIPPLSFDWPNNLIKMIERSYTTPKHPEFKFILSAEAASHNLNILSKYYWTLTKHSKHSRTHC